ncbi:YihY/virulence factor BrkB family protein [Cognatishimia sp. SS12]|uniref:YihY/virulence factor BrkB family protein n=1 Tax=Cognatishimia sp. SS12 TaxID=2979465 RepID=UPI00232E5288|nr:YihY/virulence factor BrkB family protein [Cognatishimia sp. SS12]MDC0737844.1 YihY/virulence factor BrkB family protein [Cognatishimia sp. SS12]
MAVQETKASNSKLQLKAGYDLLRRVWARQGDANAGLLAAGIAFYALLSLFPAITAGAALAGMTISPQVLSENSQELAQVLPEDASAIIFDQLRDVLNADNKTLGFAALITLGMALFSASKATGQAMTGLNEIFDLEESRGFIMLTVLKVGLTLFAILLLVLAVSVTGPLPALADWFGNAQLETVLELIRWPILLLVGAFGVTILYRYGPDRDKRTHRWVTIGAIVACLLWFAASVGFTIYAESFGSYNQVFGALGGVIILLTWLWLSAYAVLLGAALDAELIKGQS